VAANRVYELRYDPREPPEQLVERHRRLHEIGGLLTK
jgi:hypothetical protein